MTITPQQFPYWPLAATLATQTLATMAAYSLPALAPVVARDLGVNGALVGYFVSMVYGVGIVSSLLAAEFIRRHGAVRASQLILAVTLAMLLVSAQGSIAAFALGAVLLGAGYGAAAPSGTHLLAPRTPPRMMNFVLSLRQIGVPLGGVLSALLLPPLALRLGWQNALLLLLVPIALALVALEGPRRRWDETRGEGGGLSLRAALGGSLALLHSDPAIVRLTLASFVYSGVQLCFVAFTTVQLTGSAGLDLVTAGQALAIYQLSGVVSRPVWGWMADGMVAARRLLVMQGFVMAGAALAAGQFSAGWPVWLLFLTCAIAGATASGYTGIAYGEYARLGGARRTEATGLGAAAMFAGVLALPALATAVVTATGSYALAYGGAALLAAAAGTTLSGGRASTLRG